MRSRIKSLSAAVIGTGFIGPVHVEGLWRAGVPVTGIVGSSPEKSKATAERLGLGGASYDAIMDNVGQTPLLTKGYRNGILIPIQWSTLVCDRDSRRKLR